MKRPLFIARQSARPAGPLGWIIARIMALETAALNDRAIERLSPSPGQSVIEVGFGHGRAIERLAAAVPDGCVCGVDHSNAMLRMALRRNARVVAEGRVDLRRADSAALPFDEARFDLALTVHTLYFWPDPAASLGEIRRVLRQGGRLALGFVPAESSLRARLPAAVYRLYPRRAVETMLAAAGFTEIEFAPVGAALLALATASEGAGREAGAGSPALVLRPRGEWDRRRRP